MTLPVPSGLTYGTVSWNVIQMLADSLGDIDSDPDVSGVTGTVSITPNVSGPVMAALSNPPVTVFNGPYTFSISNGQMVDAAGRTQVELLATDCQVLSPGGWNYKANFTLQGRTRGSFNFFLPTGTNVDLTTVTQVPASLDATTLSGLVGYVNITSGTEPRPAMGMVIWSGGTTAPVNMANGDLWFTGGAVVVGPANPDTTAPSVPVGLASGTVTPNGFTVSWNASTDDVAVTGYRVYRNGLLVTTTGAPTYTFTGLSPQTTYAITVDAGDAAGNHSAQSASINVTTGAPDIQAPTVPTGLSASGITQSSATVSWNASTDNVAVVGYQVYRNGTPITTVINPTYTLTGLTPGTTYTITVSASDAAGNTSAQSAGLSVTTTAPDTTAPSVPTGLSASSITQSGFTVSWSASTDAVGVTGYRVYRDGTLVASPTATTYTFTGLNSQTTYAITVDAGDAAGNHSAQSSALNVSTSGATTAPGQVTGLAVNVANTTTSSITLTWTATAGASAYAVQTSNNGFDFTTIATGLTSPTATISGLNAGTSGVYRVFAGNSFGDGPVSTIVLATTAGGAPAGTWVNKTLILAPSSTSGTTYHFTPATAGQLLVAFCSGQISYTTPTGWTLVEAALSGQGLYVFTKVATAGESTFTSINNGTNYESFVEVLAFNSGSTIGVHAGTASGTIAVNAPNPSVTPTAGQLGIAVADFTGDASTFGAWSGSATEIDHHTPVNGTYAFGGCYFSAAYQVNSPATAWAPTLTIQPQTSPNKQAITFTVNVT